MKKQSFNQYLNQFKLQELFIEMGWDEFEASLPVSISDEVFNLEGVAEKGGFVILTCPADAKGKIPHKSNRKQLSNKVAKNYYEHLIIYTNKAQDQQVWQLPTEEENKPRQVREVQWYAHQDPEILFQRLRNLFFEIDEEDEITIVDVKQRVSENFAKNTEQVTKRFYTEFKKQHTAFLNFIQGIDDHLPDDQNANKQWYTSLMLNRLMFCYFIQKKGFLNGDVHYLQNKLQECRQLEGNENFYNFYRNFLLHLFHDGLGKPEEKRSAGLPLKIGKIPYLNGGLFDIHELEQQFSDINISDEAFQEIFNFFDQWNWHLDNSFEATGRDINPDVIGYIFEKYINDRASMGAYYTKEDITEYIGKNTIIPFLFDETERRYKAAFKPESHLWQFLKNSGDTYIYDAVKHGVPEEGGLFDDLPEDIQQGFRPDLEGEPVKEETSPHLWEIRETWNRPAPEDIALPTELYREVIDRRKRYAEVKEKIENGEITHINDFITYNLNIRQFIQDYIENTEDADFIQYFYKSLQKVTILDPTCGSGAFLFAALNILEPLYEACIERMEEFVAEEQGKHRFFENTLLEVKTDQHPSLRYFIYKTIILKNLYGVDLMKEAVEIAKLRLFLKMVATVDVNHRKPNLGLEPLPDIDFNIRSGNTLVGFASEEELLQELEKDENGQTRLGYEEELEDFREQCDRVSKAHKRLHDEQLLTDKGSENFQESKGKLRDRLEELNEKLNKYLAESRGIQKYQTSQNSSKRLTPQYRSWLESHKPFHWLAEFYDIITKKGGFDVIIGNPPYAEYSPKTFPYYVKINEWRKSNNLYALSLVRASQLSSKRSSLGMIVLLSLVSTKRMQPVVNRLRSAFKNIHFSQYEGTTNPGTLFEGVKAQLSIALCHNFGKNELCSSHYNRAYANERPFLFENLFYVRINNLSYYETIPKVSSQLPLTIINRLLDKNQSYNTAGGKYILYFRNMGNFFWKLAFPHQPLYMKNKKQVLSSTVSFTSFYQKKSQVFYLALVNSSTFFLYWNIFSDCYHLSKKEILKIKPNSKFPFDKLKSLTEKLFKSLESNGYVKREKKKNGDVTEYFRYFPQKSKNIIDAIDIILATSFKITEDELDFIINYEIKYRMGQELYEEQNELA